VTAAKRKRSTTKEWLQRWATASLAAGIPLSGKSAGECQKGVAAADCAAVRPQTGAGIVTPPNRDNLRPERLTFERKTHANHSKDEQGEALHPCDR